MFNTNKKRQLIDYQNSYYYQKKRIKLRQKWLKGLLLLLVFTLLAVIIVPLAQSQNIHSNVDEQQLFNSTLPNKDNNLIYGPQLLFNQPNKATLTALPIDIRANIEVNGLLAHAQIKQVFVNPYDIPLEGKYQFPLPEKAAIKHLKVKVAGKTIIGQIMEKQVAKAVYNKAKRQGKKASLVQQQRANLFTNNIANIPAHATVVVTLTFIMPVEFFNGELHIDLPLAMTKRYQPVNYRQSPAEQPVETNTSQLNSQNERFIQSEISNRRHLQRTDLGNYSAKSEAIVNITLNAGVDISSISSASHHIHTKAINNQQSQYLITLANLQASANKNVNLTWKLEPSQKPKVSSFTEKVADEYYTLLTFFPSQVDSTAVFARDIIFIIDTSGSMQGSSMEQAKSSLQHAISLLNDNDSFNIIAFDNSVDLLFSKTQMVTDSTIKQAKQFINNLQADGGTEMYRPLSQALMMAKNSEQSAQAIRQVVFITDGAVANEFELMQLLDGAQGNFRLFTVGIGAAPNGYFMKKAAQFGRGSYVFIQNSHDVQTRMSGLMSKISQPVISNISLMFDNQIPQQIAVYPKKITDLYLGEPMQVAIKSTLPISSVQILGDSATQPWYQQLIIDDSQSAQGISTIWARRKIEDLLDGLVMGDDKEQVKQQVIATSINHQIISPYTSFIAVEKQAEEKPLTASEKALNERTNDKQLLKDTKHSTLQANNLTVAMPQTALGWQQQWLIGLLLLLLAPLTLRVRSL